MSGSTTLRPPENFVMLTGNTLHFLPPFRFNTSDKGLGVKHPDVSCLGCLLANGIV